MDSNCQFKINLCLKKKTRPELLSVAAVIGSQFKFHPGCQLVSGLYLIFFKKEVKQR